MVTFTGTVSLFENNLWGYHIPVSNEIAGQLISGSNRRVVCTINDLETIHSALMPRDDQYYIMLNKRIRAKLGLIEGSKIQVNLKPDTSEYGMPMPESLMVLLDQDQVGSKYFHALTPGKQRSLIYVVSQVKNVNSQLNKGMAILEHLTEFKGEIEYKALQEKIKEYNQRGKMNF